MGRQSFVTGVAAVALCAMLAGVAIAQTLAGPALADALRNGGHNIVMRHAASPKTLPTAETAAPGNARLERQLDATGKQSATALGASLRTLKIPVGEAWSSPTFRAMETAQHAGLTAKAAPELGDGGAQDWLKAKAAERPPAGSNRLYITHAPNISGAFGQMSPGVADGEALVFRPDGAGGAALVGRVKIEEWPKLAGP